jgi:ActR/RegA family two-component response regulator
VRSLADPALIGGSHTEVSMPIPRGHRPTEPDREPICIIDDDESVAGSLKALLETLGFEVQSYSSGSDFLADDHHRTAGCLVIDQHMPV